MDILVITWNYPPRRGGMEQLLASLCSGLSKNHRVTVITAHAKDKLPEETGNLFRPALPGLLPFFLFALRKGAVLLRANPNIGVVLGGSVLVTPIVLLLARLFRRKAVILAHGLDLLYPEVLYQMLMVRWLRLVDRVIANSRHTAALARTKGVRADRIIVIPPGVDCARFDKVKAVDGLKQRLGLAGTRVILFVGRLAPRKGVQEFIERSLPQIVAAVPQACFVIVGNNPSESLAHRDDVASGIGRLVARLKLSQQVRWLGAVSDEELVDLYSLCDMLLLPARELAGDVEGFGMVALEAAAAGKPVVATRVGGIADAVADGASGMLVNAEDYAALTRAVVSLLQNSTGASAMGEEGRRRALREFDWRVIVARYEIEFSKLTGANEQAR